MNYLTLINSKFVDYKEVPMFRIESWLYDGQIYDCLWFYSNDSAIPNTIQKRK